MRNNKWPFHFFLLSILLTIALTYIFNSFPPSFVITLSFLAIPLFPLAALLFIGAVFSLCTYLFHSHIQGILIALFVTMYLFLRYINLTNIFFLILLAALFGTLELFFLKKK